MAQTIMEELEKGSRADLTPKKKSSGWKFLVGGAVALTLITGGLLWWLEERHFESTDDAQIEAHVDPVSSRISGTVVRLGANVDTNQYVQAGALLVELDPNDYAATLEHAKADLATREGAARSAGITIPITRTTAFSQLRVAEASLQEALAGVSVAEANLNTARHKVEQDEATFARSERDRQRYLTLVEKHEISRSEYDTRETEARTAQQALEADRAAVISAEQQINQAQRRVEQRRASVEGAGSAPDQVSDATAQLSDAAGHVLQARADVHTAELNLSYTKIYAPVSGIIGRRLVEPGQRVQPGQSLLAIVPVDDIWVTANFKETQLRQMKPGQPATIHVDTFNRDYNGYIENLPGAAGTIFSLLPPENATGNYVKVVQRMPVRLRFAKDQDPQHLLRPGMSVEPRVKVQ
jgi:membrane fusion protein (multidrug efflux system)